MAGNIDANVSEYDLSMVHASIMANLQDIVLIHDQVEVLYQANPAIYQRYDVIQMLIARLIVRCEKQLIGLRQELKAVDQKRRAAGGGGGAVGAR